MVKLVICLLLTFTTLLAKTAVVQSADAVAEVKEKSSVATTVSTSVASTAATLSTTPVTVAAAPTTTKITTTTPKPKVNVADSALCKKCSCIVDAKLLDCRNKSMSSWFTDDDWNTLENGDLAFETIRLEHNKITAIPILKTMPVKNLYLSFNEIVKIELAAFQFLGELTVLDLAHNNLTSKALVPDVFKGNYSNKDYLPLENMRELNLGYNELHTLDADLFEHLPKLEVLILGGNTFQVINHLSETAIAGLSSLKTLDLAYMELKELPDNLLHSPRDLETLILSGNLFKAIPAGLSWAANLENLNLDDNPLDNLDGKNIFPPLKKLKYLSISFLPDLVRIGKGALSNLTGLTTLVASNNPKLSSIDVGVFANPTVNPEIFDYPPLEKLYLHNNNLTVMERGMLVRWDKVKAIDLRYNLWECECTNSWLIHTLMSQINTSSPMLTSDVNCATPPQWKSVPLMDLNSKKKTLRCVDDSHPEKDGRLLIGLLIGVLVGIPMTFGAIILYQRGCFGLLNRRNAASPLYNRASFTDDFHL